MSCYVWLQTVPLDACDGALCWSDAWEINTKDKGVDVLNIPHLPFVVKRNNKVCLQNDLRRFFCSYLFALCFDDPVRLAKAECPINRSGLRAATAGSFCLRWIPSSCAGSRNDCPLADALQAAYSIWSAISWTLSRELSWRSPRSWLSVIQHPASTRNCLNPRLNWRGHGIDDDDIFLM